MKRVSYQKRNLLLTFLSVLFCILLSFSFVLVKRASAEEPAPVAPTFGLKDGAAVRLSKDYENLGIRYQFSMSKENYEKNKADGAEFGIIIVPEDLLTAGREINAQTVFGIGGKAIYNWATWNGSEWAYTSETGKTRIANYSATTLVEDEEDGSWGFSGSLVNLKEQNILREFRGYAYVKQGNSVEFVSTEENVRSMAYVAQKAVEDPKNVAYVDVLQTSYLSKVADKNGSYTVNYHKVAADGTETVETETFTAALGVEVTASPKEIAGYVLDESNPGTKTSGKIYANTPLELHYYYTGAYYEDTAFDSNDYSIVTVENGVATETTAVGVAADAAVPNAKVYAVNTSGITTYRFTMNGKYTEHDSTTVGVTFNYAGITLTAPNGVVIGSPASKTMMEITVLYDGSVYCDGALVDGAKMSDGVISFDMTRNESSHIYAQMFISETIGYNTFKKSAESTAFSYSIVTVENGNATTTQASRNSGSDAEVENSLAYSVNATGIANYRFTLNGDYTLRESTTVGVTFNYVGITLTAPNGGVIGSPAKQTIMQITVLKDGSVYCDGALVAGAKMSDGVFSFDVTRNVTSHAYATMYVSKTVGYNTFTPPVEEPVTNAEGAYTLYAVQNGSVTSTEASGINTDVTGMKAWAINGTDIYTYRVTVTGVDYTEHDSTTVDITFNYAGVIISAVNGVQIGSPATAKGIEKISVLKDGTIYYNNARIDGAQMTNGVITFDVTRKTSGQGYAQAYFGETISFNSFAPRAYVIVTDGVFTNMTTSESTTEVPAADGFTEVTKVTGSWNASGYSFANVDLTVYEEVKFAVKSIDKKYGMMQGGAVIKNNEVDNGHEWYVISLEKNGANWDLYYGGVFQQTLTLANNNLNDLTFRFNGTYYVSELKGAIDPNHTHVYEKVVVLKNSTCTEDGLQKLACLYCDDALEATAITERKSHSYTTATVGATCNAPKTKTSTCLYCGDVQTTTEGAALEHSYGEATVIKVATCSKEGEQKQECAYCGDAKVTAIAKLPHTDKEVTVKAASDYAEGLKHTECSVCGEVVANTEVILPATGLGVSYTIAQNAEETIALSAANITPSIIDENGAEKEGYTNNYWEGSLVAKTLNDKAGLLNGASDIKTTDGSTTQNWRYYRYTIHVNFTDYQEASFEIAGNFSRSSTYTLKLGEAAITITKANDNQQWRKITVKQDGSVYFQDSLVEGKISGNAIVLDLITDYTGTQGNYDAFYIASALTTKKTTRNTALSSSNASMVALEALGSQTTIAPSGYVLSTDGNQWTGWTEKDVLTSDTKIQENGTNVNWQYFRYTVGIDYRKFSEVAIFVGATGVSGGLNIVVDSQSVAIPAAKTWYELTVMNDGTVYFNDTLVDGATMTDGIIVFELDCKTAGAMFSIKPVAQIKLGDFAGYEETELVLNTSDFSQCVIDESGNVVEGATNTNWYEAKGEAKGNVDAKIYRLLTQNSSTSEADYHRYFRATIKVDFTKYEYVSFRFYVNEVQSGAGCDIKLGGVKYNLQTAKQDVTVKVTKDGIVYVNDVLLVGAQMTGNQIVMDIDTNATALNYRCLDVYPTFVTANPADTELSLVKNNVTQYAIVKDSNAQTSFAATELSTYFNTATGLTLNSSSYTDTASIGGKRIVLGVQPAKDAGLDFTGLKSTDYRITAVGSNLYIYSPTGYGVINGVYALLEELFGLDIYYKGVYTINNRTGEDIAMPLDYDSIGDRTFDYIWAGTGELTPSDLNGNSEAYANNMGMVTNYYAQNIAGGIHNATQADGTAITDVTKFMITESQYGTAHPEWFYKENGVVKQLYLAVEDFSTAEGSLVYTVAEKIWAEMLAETRKDRTLTLMFSHMDNGTWPNGSNYPKSQALKDTYGTYAAENIMFMNAVASLIDAKLAESNPYGDGQKITMQFLSYHQTLVAPDLTRAGLTAEQIEAVKLYKGENVKVVPYVAPVEANYYMAFTDGRNIVRNPENNEYDSDSPTVAEVIKGWNLLSDEIHLWWYSLDASNYFMPVDILTNMQANYKFAAENGVTIMNDQNQYNEYGAMTDWARLKNYVRSELAKDIDTNVDTAIDNFMNAYFGAGAESMKTLLSVQQTWYEKLVAESKDGNVYYAGNLHGSQSLMKKWCFTENPDKPTINLGQGSADFVKSWMGHIEAAKAAINADSSLTADQKTELCKRVDIESLTARYILIAVYGDKSYDNSTAAFYAFAKSLGMTQSGENGAL